MKTAIVISLGELEGLMKEFCAEKHSDLYKRTLEELRLSELLLWIRKRKEQSDAKEVESGQGEDITEATVSSAFEHYA